MAAAFAPTFPDRDAANHAADHGEAILPRAAADVVAQLGRSVVGQEPPGASA
jgi:hypothetical protein